MSDHLARSFDLAAEDYERGRPGYAERALDAPGLPSYSAVLDLAAGTGKLSRQLVPRFDRVVAVEPLDGMRAVLERLVPGAEVRAGTAEEIPLRDGEVDAVFVGEAFHWFPGEAALTEIARVLRPGGTLAVLFNQSDGELEPAPPQAFWEAYRARALTKAPQHTVGSGLWRAPFPGPFEALREASFPNPLVLDRDGLLAQVASWSMVAGLGEAERSELLAELGRLLPAGDYRLPLRTDVYWTRLSSRT